MITPPQQASS